MGEYIDQNSSRIRKKEPVAYMEISENTIKQRIKKYNWSEERARTERPHGGQLYICFEKPLSISEMAEQYGVQEKTLRNRLKAGMTPEEAVKTKTSSKMKRLDNRIVRIDGEEKTVAEWAAHFDISMTKVRSRVSRHGWDIIEALTWPIGKHRT